MGSPLLAIESAMEHVNRGTLKPDVTINFIFVESNASHAAHLRKVLGELSPPQQFKISVIDGKFRDCLDEILNMLEAERKSLAPTFAFVDPFGFSGIPMSLMARILKFERCEVLVNIMVDFINRFLEHPNNEITAHFPDTFGTSDVLAIPQEIGNRLDHILKLYRRQLSQHGKYVGRFDMHGRKDRKTYSLYFATNAPRGFEKMKEAMWAVDKYTGSKFSDAELNSACLFDSLGYEPLWDDLTKQYAGTTVPMSDLEKFVVEKTDYLPTHARKILARREESGQITVDPMPNCKRRGKTFPSDKVRIIFPS